MSLFGSLVNTGINMLANMVRSGIQGAIGRAFGRQAASSRLWRGGSGPVSGFTIEALGGYHEAEYSSCAPWACPDQFDRTVSDPCGTNNTNICMAQMDANKRNVRTVIVDPGSVTRSRTGYKSGAIDGPGGGCGCLLKIYDVDDIPDDEGRNRAQIIADWRDHPDKGYGEPKGFPCAILCIEYMVGGRSKWAIYGYSDAFEWQAVTYTEHEDLLKELAKDDADRENLLVKYWAADEIDRTLPECDMVKIRPLLRERQGISGGPGGNNTQSRTRNASRNALNSARQAVSV